MPRSGRGGRRTGTPGKAYGNRTDLNAAALPVTTAPGQEYGAQTAQANAQRAVPMASGDITAPGAASPVSAPGGTPQGQPSPVSAGLAGLLDGSGALPAGMPAPGSLPPLNAPSDRPDEHLMTGVPAGPGPGPEALHPLIAHPLVSGVAALNSLGGQVSPQLAAIRGAAQAMLANASAP